ncbi:MAG: YkgJ family cysteine cluster protein [Proteocatella sp.]
MNNTLKSELNKIYNKVPAGDCTGCANCCQESVGASFAEAQVIFENIKKMPQLKRSKLLERIFEYYFEIYQNRKKCPFLDENKRCEIYDSRPLNCRLYGHWKEKEYNENYKRLYSENKEIKKIINEQYGYKINEDYVLFNIPYCKNFEGRLLSKHERNELYDELIVLDSKLFLKEGFEMAYEDKGIVEHIVDKLLSKEKIFDLKMKGKLSKKMKCRLIKLARLRIGAM